MLKRTKGRLLLTLLVITGLAGTLGTSSLSQKERKQAINLIKSSRTDILNSLHGLTANQINFKSSPGEPSIGELIMTMVSREKTCSDQIKSIMSTSPNDEDRLKMAHTDDELLTNKIALWEENIPTNQYTWKDPAEALKKFIALRNQHIKYIRTSTEDLRNHVVQTSAGWIDCYQYYLLIADQSNYFAEKIAHIKSSPGFPKK